MTATINRSEDAGDTSLVVSAVTRWVVLVAAAAIMFAAGAMYAFSVFRDALVAQRGIPLDQVMTAYSINMGFSPIPMILGGRAVDRGLSRWVGVIGGLGLGGGWILSGLATSGPQLWLTYGVLAGLGQGLCYAAGLSNTLKFFPDKRGLVAGILTGANGGATIVLAPVVTALNRSGVSRMMIILGLCFLAVVLVASVFIRVAPVNRAVSSAAAQAGTDRQYSSLEMVRTPTFWLIFGVFVCGAFSGLMIAGNAAPIGRGMFGLSVATAALFVSLYSAANMAGRLVFGFLSDRVGQIPCLLTVFAVVAVSLVVLVVGKGSVPAFAVGLIGLGLCYGGVMGIMPAVVMSSFGARNQGVNYGLAFAAYSTAALFAPKMAATIGLRTGGDYSQAFVVAIGAALAGFVLSGGLKLVRRR